MRKQWRHYQQKSHAEQHPLTFKHLILEFQHRKLQRFAPMLKGRIDGPQAAAAIKFCLRSTAKTLADLSRPMDPGHLKTRKQHNTTPVYCPWNIIARHLHHRALGWSWEVRSAQEIGGAVVVTGRLTIPSAAGDLLHCSAVASEP
jgi:hypothetical protein